MRTFAVSAGVLFSTLAHADVTISSGATTNMSCSGGVCAPTAKKAVLNVIDLENLLALGNIKVTTAGSGVQADDITIEAPLGWSDTNLLALDAYRSILVEKPVSVSGAGGLSVTTNDGGENGYFGLLGKGHVIFANLSDALTINGAPFILVGNIATLAADIAANSAGNYALANDFDASNDGTYATSPVPTHFSGFFEGLGNTISRLSIDDPQSGDNVGLFAELASGNQPGGAVENITLQKLNVGGSGVAVGGLVGLNDGTISGAFVNGTLTSDFEPEIGELVGYNLGTITRSGATGTISNGGQSSTTGGGLVGGSFGTISQSYADCVVSVGDNGGLGGLVGGNGGRIEQSYAIGSISGGSGTDVGGLVGGNSEESTITQSYSTTALKGVGRRNRTAGGLIGVDDSPAGSISSSYWDISTSHIKNLKDGAGTPRHDPGITGLTTDQLQSGLPKGFDPKVWAENPQINNGLPYLINNPPEK